VSNPPPSLRAFTNLLNFSSWHRLFILINPVIYGPFFAWVASQTHLAFGIVFAIVTGMTMIGLLNVEVGLEDPFSQVGLDGIRTAKLFSEIITTLQKGRTEYQKVLTGELNLQAVELKNLHHPDSMG